MSRRRGRWEAGGGACVSASRFGTQDTRGLCRLCLIPISRLSLKERGAMMKLTCQGTAGRRHVFNMRIEAGAFSGVSYDRIIRCQDGDLDALDAAAAVPI